MAFFLHPLRESFHEKSKIHATVNDQNITFSDETNFSPPFELIFLLQNWKIASCQNSFTFIEKSISSITSLLKGSIKLSKYIYITILRHELEMPSSSSFFSFSNSFEVNTV